MFSFLFNFYAEALQLPKEMGIAFGDMLNAGKCEAATTAESDDCEGHEQPVVVVTIDDYTTFDTLGLPLHEDGVAARSDRAASSLQFKAQVINTIGFFVVEILYIIEDTLPISEACKCHQDGYTIDGPVTIHLDAA